MPHRRVAIAVAVVLLAACAQAPPRPDSSTNADIVPARTNADASAGGSGANRIVQPEPTGVLSLEGALAATLARNPQLASAGWEVRAAAARAVAASVHPNPELAFEVEEFGGEGDLSGLDAAEYTLSLSQEIPLGDRIDYRTAEAAIRERIAARERDSVRLDVLTEATKAFVAVLVAQELLALAEERVRAGEEVVRVASEKVRAGKSPPLESQRANVTQSLTLLDREQARADLEVARGRLASTWGSPQARFQAVAGNLRGRPPLVAIERLVPLIAENPDLARWEDVIEAQRAGLLAARSEALPDLTLTGGVKRAGEGDLHSFLVGVSVPLPLFDRNQGGIAEARAVLRQAAEMRRAAEVRIETELREAWRTMSVASGRSETLLGGVLPAAESAFEASREGFRQGKFSYLYVLDAQRTLFDAQTSLVGALSSYHTAVSEVERLVGRSLSSVSQN